MNSPPSNTGPESRNFSRLPVVSGYESYTSSVVAEEFTGQIAVFEVDTIDQGSMLRFEPGMNRRQLEGQCERDVCFVRTKPCQVPRSGSDGLKTGSCSLFGMDSAGLTGYARGKLRPPGRFSAGRMSNL